MPRRRRWPWILGALTLLLAAAGYLTYGVGRHEGPGAIAGAAVPRAVLAARDAAQAQLAAGGKQVLFGDLHVHTTFSADAFMRSLPLVSGEGAHPPADACDFARYCSGLDFFSLNDHAEALTPRHWREEKESVRQCNALAGDPAHPDLVAFVGWEWSQVGLTPEEHYGHKNVIFRDLDDAQLPARPIGAPGLRRMFQNTQAADRSPLTRLLVPIREFPRRQRYLDLEVYQRELDGVPDCPAGDVHQLPLECRETAATPAELFRKLDEWGFPALVIPHGTTWGFYTPPGYRWDKQLDPAMRSDRQRLVEVYSGHGNSEQHRAWREVGEDGMCPGPTPDYEPCCWRAGELIRARCGDAPADVCESRVAAARAAYLAAGAAGHLTVPGATVEDWRDCGQCRDCFAPAFNYRPAGSVQALVALGERMGFIASSDNHSARPGSGYKELARRRMTDATGPRDESWRDRFFGRPPAPTPEARPLTAEMARELPPFQLAHLERQASFFLTGGLAAVHSEGRSREAIWAALERKETYGTSGPRILLWFDLVNAPGGPRPMGGEARLAAAPRFVVRAAGDFVQRPGCPAFAEEALGRARLDKLCAGECVQPGDQRLRIVRVEVVRIRPRRAPDEPLAGLIDDPWRTLPCPPDPAGCRVELEDPEFVAAGRETSYYVRAIQEPTPAVNAAGLRCSGEGCAPCYGDYRTPYGDDCLAPNEERAWSSPIRVLPEGAP